MTKRASILVYAWLCCILTGCDFSDTPHRTWEHSGLGSYAAKLSPDGTHALVATVDLGTHLWDLDNNKSIFMFTDETGEKTPHKVLAFKPPIAVTAFEDQCVVWHTQKAQSLAFWKMPGQINSMALTDDGRFVLFGLSNHQGHLIDLATGFTFRIFEHADTINSVTFSKNEQFALLGSDDTSARLWDLNTGEMAWQWFHDRKITYVAISPNSEYALLSSSQHKTEIKNTKTGETQSTLAFNSTMAKLFSNQKLTVTAAVFSPDHQTVFTGSPPRHIYQWRISDGALLNTWVLPSKSARAGGVIPFDLALNGDEIRIQTSNGRGFAYKITP